MGYYNNVSHSCVVLVASQTSWGQAESYCVDEHDGRLLEIHSVEVQNWIENLKATLTAGNGHLDCDL